MKKMLSTSALLLLAAGCARVTVDPIEVKPIHIVQDINIRIDRQLDEYFAYQDRAATQPAATQPASTAANAPQGVTQ
jgi:hypothetical protein